MIPKYEMSRFNDGLLLVVELGKIVPDHHARKEYL